MKILVMLTRKNNRILRTEKMLTDMGHEVKVIYVDHFQSCHSYIAKKLDELGLSHGKEKYDREIFQEAMLGVQEWGAERVLHVNFSFFPGWREKFREACNRTGCMLISFVIDPAHVDDAQNVDIYGMYDKAFFYEEQDAIGINKRYNLGVEYCPVGFNDAYAVVDGLNRDKNIDITFVGAPYKRRMRLLERLAVDAKNKGWTLRIYGPFFDDSRYFWKKYIRMAKFPNICRVLTNGVFDSDYVADIYSQTKICLNMHVEGARGLNPRSFEIMATGAMEMVDMRDDFGIFKPNADLVAFENYEDLVRKIDYYLRHNAERVAIAASGQKKVQRYSMGECLQRMLAL